MSASYVEKRQVRVGSIICENGFIALRVIRSGASLQLSLDALDAEGEKVSLLYAPAAGECRAVGEDGGELSLLFYAFDPVPGDGGETCGVKLLGTLGAHAVTLTALADQHGPWCQLRCEIRPRAPITLGRLRHCWRLLPEGAEPDIAWPRSGDEPGTAAGAPAAFFQIGPLFAALVPDPEDGDRRLFSLQDTGMPAAGLAYGLTAADGIACGPGAPCSFSYALCLDARALPECGFQEVVRFLGASPVLRMAALAPVAPRPARLPELPPAPDAAAWTPCRDEGTPAEMAAVARKALESAGEEDWATLERGLRWLDRLCLQQVTSAVVDGVPAGGFAGGGWPPSAPWMPPLLLLAFRLTGIREYAERGVAALAALPDDERAGLLAALREGYGDLYLNIEYGEAVLLMPLDRFDFRLASGTVKLLIVREPGPEPLRLVVDGAQEAYVIQVNGEELGELPAIVLRAGILLPL